MAGQHHGYAIGVDLGTSNTVAVLRWPDGRTRPLLFDGQPIMPSGVFLDVSGRLHVGRDAQRLAQVDPARYEPNPKRRVDESGVLLGDREVPTVELLAALLRAVAQGAVEAVGFVPPAVLTYPAGWGARRREVLVTAVARAGWPPARTEAATAGGTVLVPEPVAAARYFADVLRRPVPVGSSLAVFDFGGGTLDIAVVRNSGVDQYGRARFEVIGSGGIAELGGLDLDAVLVDHLGGVIGAASGDVWRHLSQPTSTTGWRNRRQFWDDVRGAKEMLSRTTLAPVPVPGVDQAVHLTRDELERLAAPLLRRGVFEAASVIAACRLAPHQLAGLFLVGGSSRVPLVARMLHADLGVAPTVLEQPELPVAEGALAEAMLVGPAPTAGAPTAPAPSAPAAPGPAAAPGAAAAPGPTAPAPAGSPAAATSSAPAAPPAAATSTSAAAAAASAPVPGVAGGPGSRRTVWIVAAAVLALAGVVTAAVLYLTRGGYDDIEFQTFADIGRIAASEENPSYAHTAVLGDRAYMAVERSDNRRDVVAAETGTAKQLWSVTTDTTSDRWLRLAAVPNALLVFADAIGATTPRELAVLDPADGAKLWSMNLFGEDDVRIFEDVLVVVDRTANRLVGRDLRSGRERWTQATPKGPYDFDTAVYTVTTDEDLSGPGLFAGGPQAQVRDDDQRIVQISADRSARVIDATNGKVLRSRTNVAEPDDVVLAHEDRLYAADGGYQLAAYDLASMGEPRNLYRAADDRRRIGGLVPCGQDQVCLLETVSSDRATTELVAVDTEKQGERWRKETPERQLLVPVGEHVMVASNLGDYAVEVFGPDGEQKVRGEGVAARVDGGNLLLFAENPSTFSDDASVVGVHVGSGGQIQLGLLKAVRAADCSWNAEVIVCPSDSDFVFRRFAAG